jgi:hypothetical protein
MRRKILGENSHRRRIYCGAYARPRHGEGWKRLCGVFLAQAKIGAWLVATINGA